MPRSTEIIREILLRKLVLKWMEQDEKTIPEMWFKAFFEPFRDKIIKEMADMNRTLKSNAVFLIEEEWREMDVLVSFKEKGVIREELPYMLPMLVAEAQGRLENLHH